MRKNRFITAVVALVGAGVVYGLARFNYDPAAYGGLYDRYLIVNMIGVMFIPMLTVFLIFRADPAAFGFAPCASRRIWAWVAVLFAGLFVLMIFAARGARFQEYYPIFRRFNDFASVFARYPRVNPFAAAPWMMLYAELSYGMYLFCWEFFYRGYLLFGLQRSLGSVAAVALQAVAFGLLHWGKPEMLPSFGAGVILGILALNAKSFVPGFVLHWAAAIGFDVLVVAMRPH